MAPFGVSDRFIAAFISASSEALETMGRSSSVAMMTSRALIRLTTIRRNFVSSISALSDGCIPVKGKHASSFTVRAWERQAEIFGVRFTPIVSDLFARFFERDGFCADKFVQMIFESARPGTRLGKP